MATEQALDHNVFVLGNTTRIADFPLNNLTHNLSIPESPGLGAHAVLVAGQLSAFIFSILFLFLAPLALAST